MPLIATLVFVAALVGSGTYIVESMGALPERIATHFGPDNLPNGWMSRGGYQTFMLLFATLFPVALAAFIGGVPRLFTHKINIPNRDYWLAPSRRDQTLRFLAAHALWFGAMIAIFVAAVHCLILQAHRAAPPALPLTAFWTTVAVFVATVVLWAAVLALRFRNTG